MYYKQCHRWQKCSVNDCPLDPDQDDRKSLKIDPEQKCKSKKWRRLKIAKDSDLPRRGLTRREFGHLAKKNAPEVSYMKDAFI